jgi:AAA family ATP:ADP antiporter
MADIELKSTQSFPVFRAVGVPIKGRLDRMLSIFADVRAGEGAGALLMALNGFLILAASYLLKTVRETLILTEGGAEVKTYSAAGQAVLLLVVVPAYGAFASRVKRTQLINWVTLLFIFNLFLFAAIGAQGVQEGVVFYLWFGIFNVLVVAQFWAFANDLYTQAQGKRLFPIIGVGISIGALLGARAAAKLMHPLGPYGMMLVAAAILGATILITRVANRREIARGPKDKASDAEKPITGQGGFRLVTRDRYLLLIALLVVLLNVVNTSGEFLLGKMVIAEASRVAGAGAEAAAARKVFIGEFYGNFFSWVNLAGMLLQMFLVSRIFHYAGVGGALFILPLIAFSGYSSMCVVPALAIIRLVKILENATDYSIQNTAQQALFLPTSREAKYKAKAAIDTFFKRFGDVLAAAVVFAGTQLKLSLAAFAGITLSLTLVWLGVVVLIYREHARRTAKT